MDEKIKIFGQKPATERYFKYFVYIKKKKSPIKILPHKNYNFLITRVLFLFKKIYNPYNNVTMSG